MPASSPAPKNDLGVFLVGVGAYDDPTIAPVASARDNVIQWFILASRLGVGHSRLSIYCSPTLTIGDIAEAIIRWNLADDVRRKAFADFLQWAAAIERPEDPPTGDAPRRAAWRSALGAAAVARLSAPTTELLDYQADLGHALDGLPVLEAAYASLYPELPPERFQLAHAALNLVGKLEAAGWAPDADDAEVRWYADAVAHFDRLTGSAPGDEQTGWAAVASAVLALDPGFYGHAPHADAVLARLRELAARSGRGLFVFSGHGTVESDAAGPVPVLACADYASASQGAVAARGGAGGRLTWDAVRDALGDQADRWTLALDTCHAGGITTALQGSQEASAWTTRGLRARILSASQQGQRAAQAHLGDARYRGAFTWAATTVLGRWRAVKDDGGIAIGIAHGNLALRVNLLLDALSFGQRVSLSAPSAIADLPFLGYDPATRVHTDPDAPSSGIEISAGTDEFVIRLQDANGTALAILCDSVRGTWYGYDAAHVQAAVVDPNAILFLETLPPPTSPIGFAARCQQIAGEMGLPYLTQEGAAGQAFATSGGTSLWRSFSTVQGIKVAFGLSGTPSVLTIQASAVPTNNVLSPGQFGLTPNAPSQVTLSCTNAPPGWAVGAKAVVA